VAASRSASLKHCARSLAGVCVVFTTAFAFAADEPKKDDKEKPAVVITATRVPGNVFGDEIAEFTFRVESQKAIKGRFVWRVAAGSATVKAGEVELAAEAGKATDIVIKVAVPPVKDGVIFGSKLTVAAVEEKRPKAAATLERDLWIFSKDPFMDRSEWLKKRKITLYDSKGDTTKMLTAAKVPFEEVRDVAALAAVKEGLLIVGEGLSFKDEKGLAAALHKLATDGLTVLILAPAAGEVVIPGVGGPAAGLEDLTFRREIVRKLDKRLDPDGWAPDGKSIASSVIIKTGEDNTGGEIVPNANG
jgi:hypothetical protein